MKYDWPSVMTCGYSYDGGKSYMVTVRHDYGNGVVRSGWERMSLKGVAALLHPETDKDKPGTPGETRRS